MALPKRRHSKSRRDKRRTHQGVRGDLSIVRCSNCGAAVLPHNACGECGFYKGRKIDHTVTERKKEREKARER
jgi:large subunit ribosomal protein L32